MTAEAWRAVPDWPGYEVSDSGRVRSLDPRQRCAEPRVLRLRTDRTEYVTVDLHRGARRQQARVHRLVLLAFVGPCPPGHEAAHRNGVRSDNRLGNLAWRTRAANAAHKAAHGRGLWGERHPLARLTWAAVRAIHRGHAAGLSNRAMARTHGVSRETIRNVVRGRAWTWPGEAAS